MFYGAGSFQEGPCKAPGAEREKERAMTMTTMRAAAVFLLLPFLMAGISAARAQDESELRRTAEAGGEEGRAARYRLAELP